MKQSHTHSAWSSLRGLEPASFCDWPGKVSLVFFLGGCNLRCPTCHNHTLAWSADSLPLVAREDALALVDKRLPWLDALVVTGGEPTLCPDLAEWVLELKTFGLPCKVDTNGLEPGVVETLVSGGAADKVAVDVKGPWEKYPQLTGGRCSPGRARDSLEAIFSLARVWPERFFFRCTHVPLLSDEDLDRVRECLPAGQPLTVQSYVVPRDASLKACNPQSDQNLGAQNRLEPENQDGAYGLQA